MSERYTRVFSLSENLYATGSPVVIAAGALLKDNQTGKVLAQLKLRSISHKVIKAVKVSLNLFDTAGNPIGEVVEHDYLDLNVARDAEFGQKVPVHVPDKARSYTASITEVVFEDRSVWATVGEVWEPLSRPDLLQISDPELLKQYKIRFGSRSQYVPKEEKDLWYCTCGELNHTGEGCHCGNSLFALQALDMAELVAEKDARLAQEAAAAEAKAIVEKAAAEAAKKKTAKILKITIPAACAIIAVTLLVTKVVIPNNKYNSAVSLMEAEQYEEAIAAFEAMDGYKDSAEQVKNCQDAIATAEQARIEAEAAAEAARIEAEKAAEAARKEAEFSAAYADAETLAANGETAKAAMAFYKIKDYADSRERSFVLWKEIPNLETLSAGLAHTVGLRNDGTVIATGYNEDGRCNVKTWDGIVAISSGGYHTLGLCADGAAIAVGFNGQGQCNVSTWTDIMAISAGDRHSVGLHPDGTVVTAGQNKYGQCNTYNWKDIIAVSAGALHTVGLRSDGTVVAVGDNEYGQCNVSGWTDIIAISARWNHTVGLRSDGTVVAVGVKDYDYGQCNVDGWKDIVQISAGDYHTVGLHSDGTVVSAGSNNHNQCDVSTWTDIVAVCGAWHHTVALRQDGTVVVSGENDNGQCDISDWKDIKLPN